MSFPTLRHRGCFSSGSRAVEPLDPRRPLEQHEEGQERDRERRDDRGDDALRDGERGPRDPEHPRGAALGEGLADALGDLVLALEEAEAAAAGCQVLHIVRHLVDEVVHLRDDRRDDRGGERHDRQDRADEDDRDRRSTAGHAMLLHPIDSGVERSREEHRDEDPDQDAARGQNDLDQHDGGEDDSEHDEDRARSEADETLLHRKEPTEGRGRPWLRSGWRESNPRN